MQTLFENKVPAAESAQPLSPTTEREIVARAENATAADFLLKPDFLRDLGFVGDLTGEVLRWKRELAKQRLIDALKLPDGWQISAVTAGTCTHCSGDAQTALLRKSERGMEVILLCDVHEAEALDNRG